MLVLDDVTCAVLGCCPALTAVVVGVLAWVVPEDSSM